jgi:CHAD domain-containing protein
LTHVLLQTNGELAVQLLRRHVKDLVAWQAPVLANKDPEPLHQMRVSMRRLRTTLVQFEPVLQLPGSFQPARLAKTGRRLGLARDLDVLQERLQRELLPQLPEPEQTVLQPVLKQLRRERQQAHSHVVEQLRAGAYLDQLARLQRWLRKPQLTPLAAEPVSDWLLQWQLPALLSLALHPAWALPDPAGEAGRKQLHDLRKRIKTARYQLDPCRPWLGRPGRHWHRQYKQMQECLGELHDLHVLEQALEDQLPVGLKQCTPALQRVLQQRHALCWQQWRQLAIAHQRPGQRRRQVLAMAAQQRRCVWQGRFMTLRRQMCSALHPAVLCDWRRALASR